MGLSPLATKINKQIIHITCKNTFFKDPLKKLTVSQSHIYSKGLYRNSILIEEAEEAEEHFTLHLKSSCHYVFSDIDCLQSLLHSHSGKQHPSQVDTQVYLLGPASEAARW